MTPEQMRELADRLEPMAAAPVFENLPVAEFCAWLRQIAEQRPLRDEQIGDLWEAASSPDGDAFDVHRFARMIEREHGIGGSDER